MAWPNNVTEADLKIEAFRGHGKGGQKKQKTSSAIRITHIPTGITAICQDHREQSRNKTTAFTRLAERLVPIMLAEIDKQKFKAQPIQQIPIRHYRESDRIVKDKRLHQTFDYYDVMDGDGLDDIINNLVRTWKQ